LLLKDFIDYFTVQLLKHAMQYGVNCTPTIGDAPILPAVFLEKYNVKSKEQNAGKMGEILEK